MSKKKSIRRERIAASMPEADNQHETGDSINKSGQSTNPAKSSRLSRYLKTHWWAVALIAFLSLSALGATLKYLEDDARRQMADGSLKSPDAENISLLNSINPFITLPSPTPTPQLSKEYIYAGSRLLAVEDANATAVPPADLAVWRPSDGVWYVMGPGGSLQATFQWGTSGDEPVAGDYDGDGKTDFSVFRPDGTNQTGTWYIFTSSTSSFLGVPFGMDSDKPAMADYDGDGKTDIAVIRPGGTPGYTSWYILRSSDSTFYAVNFGSTTDIKAPADYDGDGKADIAVWRDSDDTFYFIKSSDNTNQAVAFTSPAITLTESTQKPVSADYDGDGRADFAVRDGNKWVILKSSTVTAETITWGNAADIAVHNDYDGDGKVDIAVWRESTGYWYIRNSSNPSVVREVLWGQQDDIPVPVFYRR